MRPSTSSPAVALLAALAVLPGCLTSPDPIDESVETAAVTQLSNATYAARALIVTNPTPLATLMAPPYGFTMLSVLASDRAFLLTQPNPPQQSQPAWNLYPFQAGADDVDGNNGPLTDVIPVGTIHPIVNSFTPITAALKTGADPFYLIAVVNRVDLAGDLDTRDGGHFAGVQRKWFGEGRLVYGVNLTSGPKPYPMTFIMEYRLPAIIPVAGGEYVEDTTFNYDLMPDPASWTRQRQYWAAYWDSLSTMSPTSAAYAARLAKIVALFAQGAHSLGMRTGEQVQDAATGALTSEFEYREFYLNAQYVLATRKLRRESFTCGQLSVTDANRTLADWNPLTNDLNFAYRLGDRLLTTSEEADLTATCGNKLPYGQAMNGPSPMYRAKFSRFSLDSVWQLNTTAVHTTEAQRHALGLGTCSGCHASETNNAAGFQILPAVQGTEAARSSYLRDVATFTHAGATYRYTPLADRRATMQHFLAGDPPLALCPAGVAACQAADQLTLPSPPLGK